jgi:hypothetical protein
METNATPAPVTPNRYGNEAEQAAWMYVTLGLPIPGGR